MAGYVNSSCLGFGDCDGCSLVVPLGGGILRKGGRQAVGGRGGGRGGMGWVRHMSAGSDILVALLSMEGGSDGAKADGWHNQARAVAKR